MNSTSTMGSRIKEMRLKKGMTQEQLAEQLFIKKSIVSCYENNRIDIKQSRIEALADILDTTIEYLINGFEQEDPIMDEIIYIVKGIKNQEIKNAILEQIKVMSNLEKKLEEK